MLHRRTRVVAVVALTMAIAPAAAEAQQAAGKDQYIVVLKSDSSHAQKERVKTKAKDRGGSVEHDYSRVIKGFAATLPDQALRDVRNDPEVAYVERDGIMHAVTTQTGATWGLDRIDQRSLPLNGTYTYTPTGSGVTAYIIDTGIRFTHQQFGGRATSGVDEIDGGSADDCNGHGTHVSGTVGGSTYGVAKAVHLVAVRVLDCNGSGATSAVIAGIDWVTSNHAAGQPAVANMSLGGSASSALDTAVRNSIADGVMYAIAAGNSNANACNESPSRVTEAVTVGATTSSDARSSFSNFGTCLDLFAPGSSITSSWNTSDTATNTISGTSMATPHVAGVGALYLQGNPSASPSTVRDAIVNSATSGVVTGAGTGSPNKLLYSPLGGSAPPPPPPPTCGATTYSGSLSGTGDYDIQPNGTYYQSTTSGTHSGCLRGPAGVDFDLYLYKWNGSSWSQVASGIGSTANEDVSYNGTPGYYYWRVVSYSGSGSYTLGITRPS